VRFFTLHRRAGWATVVVVGVAFLVALMVFWTYSRQYGSFGDEMAAVTAATGVGAVALAVVGATVALLAYVQAVPKPDIRLGCALASINSDLHEGFAHEAGSARVWSPTAAPGWNKGSLMLAKQLPPPAPLEPRDLVITLTNFGDASTRNTVVRAQFAGMSVGMDPRGEWRPISADPYHGLTEARLDSVGGLSVHPGMPSVLPRLRLDDLWMLPGEVPELVVTVAADGVPLKALRLKGLAQPFQTA